MLKMHLDFFLNFPFCLFVCVGIRAYEQLGYHAFGQPGKILAACIIILHNIGGKIKCIIHFSSYPQYQKDMMADKAKSGITT